ncbi:MAG: ABC transporter ATP-binding protein, partial [Thermodesulfobacteriota bacterium]|nr:ABC transporter ATP-binding protein [Thermodesulfobacteriota bacterium]
MEPAIIFDNVSKKFSRTYVADSLRDAIVDPFKKIFWWRNNVSVNENKIFWALKDVSFEVRSREVLGIIGRNGSGKTTTLKLLSHIFRPDGGKVMVNGRIGALIELGAGFNPDLNGRENVYLNATILGMSQEEIKRKYEDIVEFSELQGFMETPVKWYSSGMFARLGFSVAVHTEPDVLLVDEILSVGDVGFQQKCLEKMKSFRAEGATIVFVSHNMQSVSSLCDRVILLKEGTVEKAGKTEEIITYYLKKVREEKSQSNVNAELIKGLLLDQQGNRCAAFQCGQKTKIEMIVKFMETLSNIQLTIGIINQNGYLISWLNSNALSGKLLSAKKGQVLDFSVEIFLNLTSGEYELNATLYDPIKNKTIWEKIFAQFVIKN